MRRPPAAGVTARAAVMLASGVALALAFPRPGWDGLAWVALAPVLVVAFHATPRRAFGWGWLAGTAFFLVLLRWLNWTFQVFSAIPGPLTWGPIALLAAYCGLYTGLAAAAVAWTRGRLGGGAALGVFPFVWVAGEWIRGHLMGGFPWGVLGYSQWERLPVIQIAELGGVHVVSFLLAAVNAALAGAVVLDRRRGAAGLAVAAGLVAASAGFGALRLAVPAPAAGLSVALVQPAIEQPLKFDPAHAGRTFEILASLTRRATAGRPHLVVWPETSTPAPLRRDAGLLNALAGLAADAPLLVGSIDVEGGGGSARIRNSAFLVTARGISARYDKIHLVPFGEYVPLSAVIGFVRGWAEFIAELEPGTRPVVFPGPPAPFGVVICYEGIFPDLVREFVRGGARVMVNMTNDAWFGKTSGPEQHLTMYPLRAVEHRIALVRSANTGVSAIIAPSGRVVRTLPLGARGVLAGRVPLRETDTLYTRLGDWVCWAGFAVSAVALAAGWRRGSRT
ncbi:MAG: apolipoprotein N-acyltransferase [Candidatus Rokuibacteriota bacterium]